MNSNTKHLIGALLMWGGVLVAALGGLFVLPTSPALGIGLFTLAVPMVGGGAWLKWRHCPRCAGGVCEMESTTKSDQV